MDMSNVPSPEILRAFYAAVAQVGIVALIVLMIVVGLRAVWRRRRSTQPSELALAPALAPAAADVGMIGSRRKRLRSRIGGSGQVGGHHSVRGWKLLRYGLAGLWCLDGLLQIQPDMSSEFVPYVLVPLINGQPSWLAGLLTQGALLWGQHPLLFDALASWLQVALGLLVAFSGGVWLRVTLVASVVWAVVIWLAGEALGGMLIGTASWFTGAPGSALIYAGAGLLLLLPQASWDSHRAGTIIARGIAALWLLCAVLQLAPTPGNWNGSNLEQWLGSMAAMQQPAPIADMVREFGGMVAIHFPIWNAVFAGIMVLLCWLTWHRFGSRFHVWLSFVWLALTWGLGQDFGVLGGLGTDPNSAPVVALVLAAGLYQGRRPLTQNIWGARG